MNKLGLVAVIISALLFSSFADFINVQFVEANPFQYDHIAPPPQSQPPTVEISSPKNNTEYSTGNIFFEFNVSAPPFENYTAYVDQVYFIADWQENITVVRGYNSRTPQQPQFNFSTLIEKIPEGNHSILVAAQSTYYTIEENVIFKVFSHNNSALTLFKINNYSVPSPSPSQYPTPGYSLNPQITPTPILTPTETLTPTLSPIQTSSPNALAFPTAISPPINADPAYPLPATILFLSSIAVTASAIIAIIMAARKKHK